MASKGITKLFGGVGRMKQYVSGSSVVMSFVCLLIIITQNACLREISVGVSTCHAVLVLQPLENLIL